MAKELFERNEERLIITAIVIYTLIGILALAMCIVYVATKFSIPLPTF